MGDLTRNFSRSELACRCGCNEMRFTDRAVQRLQELRDAYGHPMTITSGYRCPEHNQRVSNTGPHGPHAVTEADNITVDVSISGKAARRLLRVALLLDWPGIGVKQHGPIPKRFLHFDRLPDGPNRPWLWSY